MSQELPKSINLLEPIEQPEDIWTQVYDWIFNVGRYILVFVELLVLSVFFARFYFDKINNDLTDNINSQVAILSSEGFKEQENLYRNLIKLFADLTLLETEQKHASTDVSSILDAIPSNVTLESFSFNNNKVSMSFRAIEFKYIKDYENSLRENPLYENVAVSLSKSGNAGTSDIEFSVGFTIKK